VRSSNPRIAVILAGGLGTRLRSVVSSVPKPMASIRGRPFLEHLMDYWIEQGVKKFVLSVGYKHQLIMKHFGDTYKDIPIHYAIEKEPLGTGGALLLAAQNITEPFLVLNGDTFIEVNLDRLVDFHMTNGSEWTLSLFLAGQSERYTAIEMTIDGRITSLQPEIDHLDCLANGGVYLITPSALSRLDYELDRKTSLEEELLPSFISSGGRLYGIECPGRFIDIGIPEDYYNAEKILLD